MSQRKVINFTDEVREFTSEKVASRFHAWKQGAYVSWGCGPGWQPVLYKLCIHIENVLDRYKIPYNDFIIAQVKEKLGILRCYWEFRKDNYASQHKMASEEIRELVQIATEETRRTCEFCGQPGKLRGGSWIKCMCDSCHSQGVGWRDVQDLHKVEE